MIADAPLPKDRASFESAMADIFAEHSAMRHLAECAARDTGYSADDMMSLADAMIAHEHSEARLFSLPFLTRSPDEVGITGARARRHCMEYVSGDYSPPDGDAAAARFIEALLAHLSAEEAWLTHERELKHERMLTSI
jgi:hypothetical protein